MDLPHTTIHKQTMSGSSKQNTILLIIYSMNPLGTKWGLFPPKFCLCLFPICSRTWRLLCCWAVRRKGMWQGFQRAGQKHSVIWREPCNTAESERGWWGVASGVALLKKTYPVISSTPEQLFPQLRSWHTQMSIDTLGDASEQTHMSIGQLHTLAVKLERTHLFPLKGRKKAICCK